MTPAEHSKALKGKVKENLPRTARRRPARLRRQAASAQSKLDPKSETAEAELIAATRRRSRRTQAQRPRRLSAELRRSVVYRPAVGLFQRH
jgi:hypothetical protein